MLSVWPFLLIILKLASAQVCHETYFKIKSDSTEFEFNVNHLKDHRPPSQTYKDKSNIYGVDASKKSYVFFNVADVVRGQKVDKLQITTNCLPRTISPDFSTNKPVACTPEPNKDNCLDNKKQCWKALGSCNNASISLIDENDEAKGIHILYGNGDYKVDNFLVTINCCKKGSCLSKTGLESPVLFKSSSCALDAKYCAELTSPYGCDCASRAALDQELGKKEFHCDATPSGLGGGTSTGTLILIFFFVIVGLYLAIGMGYNYYDGRRGQEMIPHLDMWKDLGGLIYDGFMYIKSCGEYREGVQYDNIT